MCPEKKARTPRHPCPRESSRYPRPIVAHQSDQYGFEAEVTIPSITGTHPARSFPVVRPHRGTARPGVEMERPDLPGHPRRHPEEHRGAEQGDRDDRRVPPDPLHQPEQEEAHERRLEDRVPEDEQRRRGKTAVRGVPDGDRKERSRHHRPGEADDEGRDEDRRGMAEIHSKIYNTNRRPGSVREAGGTPLAGRNPLPTADVVIEVGDRVVLVRRKNPPPGWAIPGGFVEVGETVETAAVREALEETGLRVTLTALLGVYSDPARDPRHHTISTVYVGRASGAPWAATTPPRRGCSARATSPPPSPSTTRRSWRTTSGSRRPADATALSRRRR